MQIDFDRFKGWIEDKFDDIKISNGKIKVDSIFCDDTKQHLWCKPSINSYKCFKSGKKGNLYELVMLVDKVSYEEAVKILGGKPTLRELESQLLAYFSTDQKIFPSNNKELQLPKDSFLISKLSPDNHWRQRAGTYLKNRCLTIEDLYICITGDFKNRIVIPYFDKDHKLVYYNARDLSGLSKIRYKCPNKTFNVNKDDVLWMRKWPKSGSKVYLTEGEFDALTLFLCNYNGAAAGGKDISYKQIQLLKDYKVCIAFDTDDSGKEAMAHYGKLMLKEGIEEVTYVRPPKQCKDWNEMYCKFGGEMVKAYINNTETTFSTWSQTLLTII